MGRGVESDEEPGRRLRSREKSQDGDDLQINSSEECLSPASDFLPSPCLSPGWGALLPPSPEEEKLMTRTVKASSLWRSWEDLDRMVEEV